MAVHSEAFERSWKPVLEWNNAAAGNHRCMEGLRDGWRSEPGMGQEVTHTVGSCRGTGTWEALGILLRRRTAARKSCRLSILKHVGWGLDVYDLGTGDRRNPAFRLHWVLHSPGGSQEGNNYSRTFAVSRKTCFFFLQKVVHPTLSPDSTIPLCCG